MFAKGRRKTGGRRAGTPNVGTERARKLIADGDDKAIVAKVITEAKAGDCEARRLYFRYLRPPPPKPSTPITLDPPRSALEARDMIAALVTKMAAAEIDRELGTALIAGLRAYLDAKAAELEALYEADKRGEGEA